MATTLNRTQPEGPSDQSSHQPQTVFPASGLPSESDTHFDAFHPQVPDDFELPSDGPMELDFSSESHVEYYPGASDIYPGGKTFMQDFFSDEHGSLRRDNLFYPFASREDWQLASWLLRSGLSMAGIDTFLKLDLVSNLHARSRVIYNSMLRTRQIKTLPISFRSARRLRERAEMLPSGPLWRSLSVSPTVPTKRVVNLYYRDPIDCIQALLSHPAFEQHISFVPRKVWSTAARLVRVYDEWLSGEHAWELQVGSSTYLYLP